VAHPLLHTQPATTTALLAEWTLCATHVASPPVGVFAIEQAKIASLDDAGFYDPFHAERARQGADKMNNISKLLSFAPRAHCLRVVLCVVRKGGAKSSSV
jgi:hypothetical protein